MSEWGFGFAFDMELDTPLDFFDVVYKNGEKVRYDKRLHGEWVVHDRPSLQYGCNRCGNLTNINSNFCPNCGVSMRVKDELNRVNKELNSEIEKLKSEIKKLKSEIENSDLPERFTATDCSCLNCKNQHSVHCEPQNKKIYGYCGNWERR